MGHTGKGCGQGFGIGIGIMGAVALALLALVVILCGSCGYFLNSANKGIEDADPTSSSAGQDTSRTPGTR